MRYLTGTTVVVKKGMENTGVSGDKGGDGEDEHLEETWVTQNGGNVGHKNNSGGKSLRYF